MGTIQTMTELAQKLGLMPGMLVCLMDPPAETSVRVRQTAPDDVLFHTDFGDSKPDVVLFWPRHLANLLVKFQTLQTAIQPDGAIWAVIPKKPYAVKYGLDFTWEELQATGLQTDLVDNKTATISDEFYGTRFVIRKERRGAYR